MLIVTKSRRKILSITLTLLGLSVFAHSPSTSAQSSAENTQYQVELIIFKRGYFNDNRYSGAESWPKDVKLSYPKRVSHLLNSSQFSETVADYERHADIYGLNVRDIESLVQENTVYPLQVEQRNLRREARRISARSEIDILFHEAWVQDIVSSEHSKALVIKGGQKFGKHYQLEGSINITRSRFLHANAKIWLTSFTSNNSPQFSNGQIVDHWPPLPNAPSPLGASYNVSEFGDSSSSLPQKLGDTYNSNKSDDNYESSTSIYNDTQNSGSTYTSNSSTYSIQNIVAINQKKKMRSGEIHYLDHPLMGAVIMIRPLEINTEESTNEGTEADETVNVKN